MTWDYLEYEVGLGEYYCFLAKAIEAEEVEVWQAAATSGNFDMKKWPDPRKKKRAGKQTANLAPILAKFGVGHVSQFKPTGTAKAYAIATGRLVVYYDPKKNAYFDESGNEVEYDSETMARQLLKNKRPN